MINLSIKQKGILPEEDFILFFDNFEKYLNNKNFTKEYFITTMTKKVCELMKCNTNLLKIVLQKSKLLILLIKFKLTLFIS